MPGIEFSASLTQNDIYKVTGTTLRLRSAMCGLCDLNLSRGGMGGIECNGYCTSKQPFITVPKSTRISMDAVRRSAECLKATQ